MPTRHHDDEQRPHSPMCPASVPKGHALALKDLCRIALVAKSPENMVAPLYQIRDPISGYIMQPTIRGGSLGLIRLQEPKCTFRAEFKTPERDTYQ